MANYGIFITCAFSAKTLQDCMTLADLAQTSLALRNENVTLHNYNLVQKNENVTLHNYNLVQKNENVALHKRNLVQKNEKVALHNYNLVQKNENVSLHKCLSGWLLILETIPSGVLGSGDLIVV